MENRRRTDYQSLIYRQLNEHRIKVARKRANMVQHMRNETVVDRQALINEVFYRYSGIEADYFNDFYAIVKAMTVMIPSWRIKRIWQAGPYYRTILADESGERPDFVCLFISTNPNFVLMYAIMTVYQLEISERLEALEKVAVQKSK